MTGALIVLAIGFLIMFMDWQMATPRDPKTRRRKQLAPTDRKKLRDLFTATLVIAVAVYFLPKLFD
jgi:hypothetical protein